MESRDEEGELTPPRKMVEERRYRRSTGQRLESRRRAIVVKALERSSAYSSAVKEEWADSDWGREDAQKR